MKYASHNEFAAKSIKQWNLNALLASPLRKTSYFAGHHYSLHTGSVQDVVWFQSEWCWLSLEHTEALCPWLNPFKLTCPILGGCKQIRYSGLIKIVNRVQNHKTCAEQKNMQSPFRNFSLKSLHAATSSDTRVCTNYKPALMINIRGGVIWHKR